MGQTVFPAYSFVGGGKQWLAPQANASAVGCALLDYGPHPSIANTRLLDWSARPVLQTPAVAAGSGTDYFAGDGTWKPYTPTTPAGSGTELQYRNGSSFAAVTGSSVSGSDVTVGGKITLQPSGSSFNDTIFRVNRPDLSEAAKIHIYNDGGGTGGYVNLSLGSTAIAGNITLGRGGGVTFTDQTANRWMLYTANSTGLYLFDYTNARMQMQFVPGTAATAQTHINSDLYVTGDMVAFRGLDVVSRCQIYPDIGRMQLISGTSYAQLDAGAAGVNSHASLALVTALGSVNLFNWHSDGKTYLDATGEFDIRVAGNTKFRINAAGRTQINGASDSGHPISVQGAGLFQSPTYSTQSVLIQPDSSSIILYGALGNTTLFNYSGDGRTYLDSSGFVLRSNGVEAVTGLGSGRVFIGTPGADPGARFTVGGNSSFQGNVDVTGTLSAAVFEPNYLRIPGTNAVTGTYVLATVGDNSIGFTGANDANSKHLIEHKACSYQVNGGGIVNYTGVRYGMVKEGTWNLGSGGTQIGAAFVVETSSGGSLSSLPTMTERFRVASDGYTAVNGKFKASSAGFGVDPIAGYAIATGGGNVLISGGFLNVAGDGYYLGSVDVRGTDYVSRVFLNGNTGAITAAGTIIGSHKLYLRNDSTQIAMGAADDTWINRYSAGVVGIGTAWNNNSGTLVCGTVNASGTIASSGSVDGTSGRLNLVNTSTGGNGAYVYFSSNAGSKVGHVGLDSTGNMVLQSDAGACAMYFDHGSSGVLFRTKATYTNWLRMAGDASQTYFWTGANIDFFDNATGLRPILNAGMITAYESKPIRSSEFGYVSQFKLNGSYASTEYWNSYAGTSLYGGWTWSNGSSPVTNRMSLRGNGDLEVHTETSGLGVTAKVPGSNGAIAILSGPWNATGYVQWLDPSGASQGHMGLDAGNNITLWNSKGGALLLLNNTSGGGSYATPKYSDIEFSTSQGSYYSGRIRTATMSANAAHSIMELGVYSNITSATVNTLVYLTGESGGQVILGGTTIVGGGYKAAVNGNLYVSDSVHANNEFRLNGGASYSRVAHMDGAGGFGGGYNFNINSGGSRDSTGACSGYVYTGSTCRFYAEASGSPGALSPRFQVAPTVTHTINAMEIYGTAGANKLAVWNNISKDYIRFAVDSDTGEATFAGGSGSMYIRPYGGSVQLIGGGYLNIGTTYTDMAFITNVGGSVTYPLTFQNANSVFGGHITSAYQTLSVDPTTSDVPSGSQRMVHNSTSGTTKLWANVGGTMKSVALT